LKIGILSDTHSNESNTRVALDAFKARGLTRLIHCGDITQPEIIYLFSGWDVVFVRGNMDQDWAALGDAANRIGAGRPQIRREIEIDGQHIGITHGDNYALLYEMMMSGHYTYICHGHTHQRRNEFRSAYSVRLINPGALGGSQPEARSICVLDVVSGEVEFIEFPTLR